MMSFESKLIIARAVLLDFVKWDLNYTVGLTLGQLLLRQGERGVPIGEAPLCTTS